MATFVGWKPWVQSKGPWWTLQIQTGLHRATDGLRTQSCTTQLWKKYCETKFWDLYPDRTTWFLQLATKNIQAVPLDEMSGALTKWLTVLWADHTCCGVGVTLRSLVLETYRTGRRQCRWRGEMEWPMTAEAFHDLKPASNKVMVSSNVWFLVLLEGGKWTKRRINSIKSKAQTLDLSKITGLLPVHTSPIACIILFFWLAGW